MINFEWRSFEESSVWLSLTLKWLELNWRLWSLLFWVMKLVELLFSTDNSIDIFPSRNLLVFIFCFYLCLIHPTGDWELNISIEIKHPGALFQTPYETMLDDVLFIHSGRRREIIIWFIMSLAFLFPSAARSYALLEISISYRCLVFTRFPLVLIDSIRPQPFHWIV